MSAETNSASAGIGFGSALAMILSFQLNHSILWDHFPTEASLSELDLLGTVSWHNRIFSPNI